MGQTFTRNLNYLQILLLLRYLLLFLVLVLCSVGPIVKNRIAQHGPLTLKSNNQWVDLCKNVCPASIFHALASNLFSQLLTLFGKVKPYLLRSSDILECPIKRNVVAKYHVKGVIIKHAFSFCLELSRQRGRLSIIP